MKTTENHMTISKSKKCQILINNILKKLKKRVKLKIRLCILYIKSIDKNSFTKSSFKLKK